ncbi:MAG: hypothetical protein FH756_10775 [Firmicutes bacterium]|nr:hypothetical protein [Bacillota bacterium]
MRFGTINYWIAILSLVCVSSFSCGYIVANANTSTTDKLNNNMKAATLQAEQQKNEITIRGKDGATCTTSNEFVIVVSGVQIKNIEDLRYRVFCGDFDSQWVSNGTITIPKLHEPGAYTARVRVSDNPGDPNSGDVQEKTFTFFKL